MRHRSFGFEKQRLPDATWANYQLAMEAYEELEAELSATEDLQALAAVVSNAKAHMKACVSSESLSYMNSSLLMQFTAFGVEGYDFGLSSVDFENVNTDKLEAALEGFLDKITLGLSNTFDNVMSSTREFFDGDIKAMDEIRVEANRLRESIKQVGAATGTMNKVILSKGAVVSQGTGKLDPKKIAQTYGNLYDLQKDMNEKYPDLVVTYMENFVDIALRAGTLFREHGKPYVANVMGIVKYMAKAGFFWGLFISFLMIPFFGIFALLLAPIEGIAQAAIFAILGVLLGVPLAGAETIARGSNATEVPEFIDLVEQGQKNYKEFIGKVEKFFKSPQPAGAVLTPNEKGVELDYRLSKKPAEGPVPSKDDLIKILDTVIDISDEYSSKTGSAKRLKGMLKKIENQANIRDPGNKMLGTDFRNMLTGTGFSKDGGEIDTSKLQLQVKRHVLASCKEVLTYVKEAARAYS